MITMKTELTDVSETRKNLTFEIPPDVVDAEISRVAKGYSKPRASRASGRARCRRPSSGSATRTRFCTTSRTT